ncbi:receptor-interacting serine/threonine-protein kinase 4 [Pyrus ussuriensis x Pyrus communis]|uniref:Receptor-interacting serine/threonine-protein kinase 4 n=1 Tax=Pyrus ussuriensis x Pyrus communis TaxID=2448454 RepID=A0A5N5FEK4_9ROSA|nr:receptor-interacting serine/threonine-protein kinase 4 [Pyrus ussuriensis x Pyrus communis]
MDSRLSEASKTGDIQLLHQLMAENPLLLHNLALTLAGHVEFVQEILKLKPAFVHEMNQDGFSPMHIAAANGYLEVVRELEGTPLHYAAARGRGDVVKEMVLACLESLEDVTLYDETSLHLAVNNCQSEAVKTLVESVMELRKDNVLNMKEKNGNSVVEWLVGNGKTPSALEVNIVNQSGLTPLDLLLIFPSEAGDREIEEILRGARASRAQNIHYTPSHGPMETNTLQLQQPNNPMEYFKFKMGRDSPSDARTALLVVAVLVATTTFQAGLSPPGGFVTFNSMGFFVSLHMICVLSTNFPMQLELLMCILAMYSTYNTAVISFAPANPMVCLSVNLWFANFAFTCCPTLPAFQDQA